MKDVIAIVEYGGRKTITVKDIIFVLNRVCDACCIRSTLGSLTDKRRSRVDQYTDLSLPSQELDRYCVLYAFCSWPSPSRQSRGDMRAIGE